MKIKSYIAKQELLEQYRTNLHKLDIRIASEGGYIHAPLNIQNQYDQVKANVELLEVEIEQIELDILNGMSIIKRRDERIRLLQLEISLLRRLVPWHSHFSVYTIEDLNIRVIPSTSGQVITILPKGEEVILLGEKEESDDIIWYKIRYNNIEGWASLSYLRLPATPITRHTNFS
jgi:uncharacterized protein YgiM (DUF1202 family)